MAEKCPKTIKPQFKKHSITQILKRESHKGVSIKLPNTHNKEKRIKTIRKKIKRPITQRTTKNDRRCLVRNYSKAEGNRTER